MKDTVIEKEGKYYIKGKVVMLATDNRENCLVKYNDSRMILQYKSNYHWTLSYLKEIYCSAFHLYITSDDEIKVGDWYLDTTLEQVIRANVNSDHKVYIESCKKIIATTDKLNVHPNTADSYRSGNCLPQPSESFIKAYIETYNNGNVIEDVLVEIEIYDDPNFVVIPDRQLTPCILHKIKLKDNNIIIKKVKDSWSRDEVLQIINAYRKMAFGIDGGLTIQQMNEWTKENL